MLSERGGFDLDESFDISRIPVALLELTCTFPWIETSRSKLDRSSFALFSLLKKRAQLEGGRKSLTSVPVYAFTPAAGCFLGVDVAKQAKELSFGRDGPFSFTRGPFVKQTGLLIM